MSFAFFIAAVAVLGAVAVFLTLPHGRSMPKTGALLGVAALAGLLGYLAANVPVETLPGWYFYIFMFISAAAAVRVITHPRPVYSALYFVLVVLSSAGLLVLLQAEFVAFAMVIIYGGAILITYMFVIMLATLPQTADDPDTGSVYDVNAREPLAAAGMGFLLLGVLSGVIFNPGVLAEPEADAIPRQSVAEAEAVQRDSTAVMSRKIDLTRETDRRQIEAALRERGQIDENEFAYAVDLGTGRVDVRTGAPRGGPDGGEYERVPGTRGRWVELEPEVLRDFIGNIDYVGLNLFQSHTLGIELAGVILLLAMVGAIVIARQKVPEGDPPISRTATDVR